MSDKQRKSKDEILAEAYEAIQDGYIAKANVLVYLASQVQPSYPIYVRVDKPYPF